ncbi:hypothetical protein ACK1C2_004545 [Salmonella enterica]
MNLLPVVILPVPRPLVAAIILAVFSVPSGVAWGISSTPVFIVISPAEASSEFTATDILFSVSVNVSAITELLFFNANTVLLPFTVSAPPDCMRPLIFSDVVL